MCFNFPGIIIILEVLICLWFLSAEIDRAFKQFVFESMDLSGTDSNGFIITRDSEGMEHSAIPWDDPYPYYKGMLNLQEKAHPSKLPMSTSPSDEERSGTAPSVFS